jgi:hypothetical protein
MNMNWKINLDKYLTTEPNDYFDSYCEDVYGNQFSNYFFETNEEWILDNDYKSQCNVWLSRLFNDGKSPKEAAIMIERAFKIFIKTNETK